MCVHTFLILFIIVDKISNVKHAQCISVGNDLEVMFIPAFSGCILEYEIGATFEMNRFQFAEYWNLLVF